eukprot:3092937-Amphidinium_carterae.1
MLKKTVLNKFVLFPWAECGDWGGNAICQSGARKKSAIARGSSPKKPFCFKYSIPFPGTKVSGRGGNGVAPPVRQDQNN